MISIILFYFYKKVFTHTDIWMIGENLMKVKNFSQWSKHGDIADADYMHAKRICKGFEIKN